MGTFEDFEVPYGHKVPIAWLLLGIVMHRVRCNDVEAVDLPGLGQVLLGENIDTQIHLDFFRTKIMSFSLVHLQ